MKKLKKQLKLSYDTVRPLDASKLAEVQGGDPVNRTYNCGTGSTPQTYCCIG